MKTVLKINSIINLVLVISACTPLFFIAAIAVGAWQYVGNILLLLTQGGLEYRVLNLKARGWYTLLSTSVLVLVFSLEHWSDMAGVAIFIGSFTCAIWYTVICQAELKNIKTRKASLDTNIQY